MLRLAIAKAFRFFFKFPFFKKKFYGIHQRIFAPLNLFKGVVQQIKFNDTILLEIHVDDWIQENIYFLGDYEKTELHYLETALKPDDVFVDLGTNIGIYSLHASKFVMPEGKVISFEPFSKNFDTLQRNASLNGASNIQLEKLAVGETNSELELYYDISEMNLGMVSAYLSEYTQKEKIQMVALDSYLEKNPVKSIDFIKIDIEGHEYKALLGMKNTLIKHTPTILIEILKDTDLQLTNNQSNIEDFLKELGYEKFFIDDKGKLSSTEVNLSRRNYVFNHIS